MLTPRLCWTRTGPRWGLCADDAAPAVVKILRVQLLRNRIAAKVTAGDAGPKSNATLAAFEKAFRQHWKRYTTCAAGYVMEDCSEFKH